MSRFVSDPVPLDGSRRVQVAIENGRVEYALLHSGSAAETGITVTAAELADAACRAIPSLFSLNPSRELGIPQWLYLALIRQVNQNAFDGEAIVDALLAHRDLWLAVLPSYGAASKVDLRSLTGLVGGDWFLDRLMILAPVDGEHERLVALLHGLGADELDWQDTTLRADGNTQRECRRAVHNGQGRVLRAWWD